MTDLIVPSEFRIYESASMPTKELRDYQMAETISPNFPASNGAISATSTNPLLRYHVVASNQVMKPRMPEPLPTLTRPGPLPSTRR